MNDSVSHNAEKDSWFDGAGGYYSVRIDGLEVARFAPSPRWSEYAASMSDNPDWSYTFVSTLSNTPVKED